jgi:uncharacterized coiled-coil DUF342 family protein
MPSKKPLPLDSLAIDCTPMAPYIAELQKGRRRGLCTERAGVADVINEIMTNQALHGESAGITTVDFAQFTEVNEQIEEVDASLPAARELVKRMENTRAVLIDKRQRMISGFAESAESRAKVNKNELLLAKYEKTRTYRSASAIKAVKTRKKNAAERARNGQAAQALAPQDEAQQAQAPAEAKPPETGV